MSRMNSDERRRWWEAYVGILNVYTSSGASWKLHQIWVWGELQPKGHGVHVQTLIWVHNLQTAADTGPQSVRTNCTCQAKERVSLCRLWEIQFHCVQFLLISTFHFNSHCWRGSAYSLSCGAWQATAFSQFHVLVRPSLSEGCTKCRVLKGWNR
jgi:hypothetical protein